MKSGLPAFRVFLTVSSLLAFPPSLSAGVATDPAAPAAAVRKADAQWAAAARAASIEGWISFYAADAIVILPDDQPASGKELVRHTVNRLLGRSHFSVAFRPIDVTVARSGDLVFLVTAYELRFDDSKGAPVSEHGRRLEVWKKQIDGGWKCSVDTWNLDAPVATPPAPPSAAAQVAAATPDAAPPLAPAAPPPPPTIPESGPPAPARESASPYGDMPANYGEAIRKYFLEHLKHPESVRYREISKPEQGFTTEITGGLLMREKRNYGWTVKAAIDAQNSHGVYVGYKIYTFLFRGEKIVDVRLPLPGDEMP
jgi:ketosteroid isomerase-like protein